jgi:hypothetical protein
MQTKAIRMILSVATASALFLTLSSSSRINAQTPARIDMEAVIKELSENTSVEYTFISADRLKQGTIVWQQPVPSGVRTMWALGRENLLVVSEKELPSPSPYVKPHEETLSIFDPNGTLLAEKAIGNYRVKDVYQSRDGSLVNIVAEDDRNVLNIITDHSGSSFLQIGYHSALMPSLDGEYFINMSGRGTGTKSTLVIDAGGRERRIPAARLINRDGSIREPGITGDFEEASKRVLWAFDNDELLFSGCESGDRDCSLTLYDAKENLALWTRAVIQPMSLEAVCGDTAASETYVLMNASANERGITSFVISRADGSITSETLGSIAYGSVGSQDGYFYSVFWEEPRFEQPSRHRFIVKHTPEFDIAAYGALLDYHGLHSMKLRGDYLYGIFENCRMNGRTLQRVTAIFDMGEGPAPSGTCGTSIKCVVPTLLEGAWHIANVTADKVELIGQLDPGDGQLAKILILRSWIE